MTLIERYIWTLKSLILNDIYPEAEAERAYLLDVAEGASFDAKAFYTGAVVTPDLRDRITEAHRTGRHLRGRLKYATIGASMVGRARLDQLQAAIETVLDKDIPGDVVECGVWRGGAMAFAKGVLAAHRAERAVWLCDSFEGLPVPDRPEDTVDLRAERYPMLAVPANRVRALFDRLALWDDNVHLLEGWFEQTLPAAPIERISVLRLDGDYFASTITALTALYDKVSSGGFVIIDDYGALEPCRQATDAFRRDRGIDAAVTDIDGIGVFWRKA